VLAKQVTGGELRGIQHVVTVEVCSLLPWRGGGPQPFHCRLILTWQGV